MGYQWPAGTVFTQRILTVEREACELCQRRFRICDHRLHRIHTLQGPVELVCKLVHCSDPHCPGAHQTVSPLAEAQLTLPHWTIGWDVFCWLGHRRFARHWSIPQLRLELRDSYQIALSEDALADYVSCYQVMLAARQQDATALAEAYRDHDTLILTIDGLQPEKGHETLYVVRELRAKRIWFAEAFLSSTTPEIQRLVAKAKRWAEQLDKRVVLWMSDKQDAFVHAVAAEFPGVPHRYCQNHFMRDVAKPVLEADSHAKVTMRKKVRGLRAIERDILIAPRAAAVLEAPLPVATPAALALPTAPATPTDVELAAAAMPKAAETPPLSAERPTAATPVVAVPEAAQVVLAYCAAVRGILNDDHGGPLQPPGLRMAAALTEVRASLQRNLDAKAAGPAAQPLQRLAGCLDRGLDAVAEEQAAIRAHVQELQKLQRLLDPGQGSARQRRRRFRRLQKRLSQSKDPVRVQMAVVMAAFVVGLFAGGDAAGLPEDNLDLERWFRLPKGHERRIHGHKHAGVRLVQEGATLMLALDAHRSHPEPFGRADLEGYRGARRPPDEEAALARRKVMRRARSTKQRPQLLAELERRYLNSP